MARRDGGSAAGSEPPVPSRPPGKGPQAGPCAQRTVKVGARTYHVVAVRFANGDFVSVSEGSAPPAAGIGSMAVSMSMPGLPPATTMVIPSKHDGMFLRLAAERASSLSAGISVVSCSTRGALGPDDARALMAEMAEMVRRSV